MLFYVRVLSIYLSHNESNKDKTQYSLLTALGGFISYLAFYPRICFERTTARLLHTYPDQGNDLVSDKEVCHCLLALRSCCVDIR